MIMITQSLQMLPFASMPFSFESSFIIWALFTSSSSFTLSSILSWTFSSVAKFWFSNLTASTTSPILSSYLSWPSSMFLYCCRSICWSRPRVFASSPSSSFSTCFLCCLISWVDSAVSIFIDPPPLAPMVPLISAWSCFASFKKLLMALIRLFFSVWEMEAYRASFSWYK